MIAYVLFRIYITGKFFLTFLKIYFFLNLFAITIHNFSITQILAKIKGVSENFCFPFG